MNGPAEAQEDDLLARLRGGERGALGPLFELYRPRLWRMVRFRMDRRLEKRLDADDVLQEAFLAAAARLDHFLKQREYSLFLWLRLITGQTLIEVHRRHLGAAMRSAGREVSLSAPLAPLATSVCLAAELADSLTSPSRAAAREEVAGRLAEAIATMSQIDQEIIALRHFEDLSNTEAAAALGLAPTAASNRYLRAIARLQEILDGQSGLFDAS